MKDGTKNFSLIDKLKAEIRVCPVCEFEIRNPIIERCPRCYGKMPRLELGCGGCIHRLLCPALGAEVDTSGAKNPQGGSKS